MNQKGKNKKRQDGFGTQKKKYRPKEQDTKSRDKPHTLKFNSSLTKLARLYNGEKTKSLP